MTVKKMIEFLSKQDPNAICVVEGPDHSYRRIVGGPCPETAVKEDRWNLSEWSGNDADYPEAPEKVEVLVFGR